jgi:lipopolysaccharide assembly protein A
MKKSNIVFKLVSIIVLLILLMIIIVQNTASVKVTILFFGFDAPVIVLIFVSLLIGFLIGLLTFSLVSRQNKKKQAEVSNDPPLKNPSKKK